MRTLFRSGRQLSSCSARRSASGSASSPSSGMARPPPRGQIFAEPQAPAPRDAPANLATKILEPFTVTTVGDVMVKRTGASLDAPEFQSIFKLLKDADVTFGNMEGNLADIEHFDGPLRGMMGDKDVAPSLKAMGFDLMNRANNHIFDSDKESMFSTMAQLDAAGIVHAGTGKNLEDARAPAFLRQRRRGASASSAMHTPNGANPSAPSYPTGNIGGRRASIASTTRSSTTSPPSSSRPSRRSAAPPTRRRPGRPT